jgi:hypothetical protein
MHLDPGGPKTYGSGSATLFWAIFANHYSSVDSLLGSGILYVEIRVADHLNAVPDTVFQSNADPDPAPHLSYRNLRPLVY